MKDERHLLFGQSNSLGSVQPEEYKDEFIERLIAGKLIRQDFKDRTGYYLYKLSRLLRIVKKFAPLAMVAGMLSHFYLPDQYKTYTVCLVATAEILMLLGLRDTFKENK